MEAMRRLSTTNGTAMRIRFAAAPLVLWVALLLGSSAEGKEPRIGPRESLSRAKGVLVVEVTNERHGDGLFLCTVRGVIKGEWPLGASVAIRRPFVGWEASDNAARIQNGSYYLVFLETSLDDQEQQLLYNDWRIGYKFILSIEKGAGESIVSLLRRFLEWETLDDVGKEALISSALRSEDFAVDYALDWITDGKLDLNNRKFMVSDRIVRDLLQLRKRDDVSIRKRVLLILGMSMRRDVVEYLVEGLSDNDLRPIAVVQLEFLRSLESGELRRFSGNEHLDERAATMLKWWKEHGSGDPGYKSIRE